MNKRSNFLPSNDQLAALAKGHVPKNTVKNTEGWINIMNQWRSDVNYKEPLENQDKETIKSQVSQFLCSVTTKNGGRYSRTSLKNALSAINWHLQNVKPGLGESKSTDGLTTEEIQHILNHEHVNLHVSQIVDTPDGIIFRKTQQKNDQGGIEGNQSDLIIPFPSDPEGISGPNSDLKKYLSFRSKDKALGNHTICSLFKTICIECGINVESRNISNYSGRRTSIIELFNIGVPENTSHAISRHRSSGGYYAYAKPTDKHKREALANILNKLINTTPSNEMAQDLTINTIMSNETVQGSIEQINPESNDNEESQSIRSEYDELSDADLNNSVQVG
ncbi:4839_t:CDS:2 [Gigaspora margarita]|uniref:4839_t:CDS:1 n=1 Tax=Gigaspora margarita TaxID=4874 RepID=A0ABN7URC3_GIGMA|nr:4839_t:CDS:2 [Gigaspora margarita]